MSAPELRTRIEVLASEIRFQKQALTKLEHEKSLLECQLNAIVDPVARLPFETSSEIFSYLSLPVREGGSGRRGPQLLLNICKSWTSIALSTPALWSAIRIDFPCTKLVHILPVWFQRAGNRPVSIFIHGDFTCLTYKVFSIVWRHGRLLKHLEISDDQLGYGGETHDPGLDILWDTIPEPLVCLETLNVHSSYGDRGFLSSQILQLLHLAPNIVECIFDMAWLCEDTSAPLVIPTLRRLLFGTCDDAAVIKFLTLPALETLSVPMRVVVSGDLLSFFKRSAPPLRELVFGARYSSRGHRDIKDSGELRECLRLVPSLARFEIVRRADLQVITDLFLALADSPSLLPNLLSLVVHLDDEAPISDSFWTAVYHALLARPTQFQVVQFDTYYSLPASKMPAPDIMAAFRELGADGTQVCINSQTTNTRSSYSFSS
jgi:hypothetical protein